MIATDILQSIFRWIHIVAGILWIGLLYFFNWVNSAFTGTMDAETKKKVVPELMPRTLFWFRWGAVWTWATGVLLLTLVFYHGGILLQDPGRGWTLGTIVMVAVTFLAVFAYDMMMKTQVNAYMRTQFAVFLILVAVIAWLMANWGGFSYRGYVIHVGAMFGTAMAYNVWFRIWPAQKKIITAIKNGEAPDPGLAAMAGLRSKHNTYMSVPLVWAMINSHSTWASSNGLYFVGAVAIGWMGVAYLYKKAAKVPGF